MRGWCGLVARLRKAEPLQGGAPAILGDVDAQAWSTLDGLERWCRSERIELAPRTARPDAGPLNRRLAAAESWAVAHGHVNEWGAPRHPLFQELHLNTSAALVEHLSAAGVAVEV